MGGGGGRLDEALKGFSKAVLLRPDLFDIEGNFGDDHLPLYKWEDPDAGGGAGSADDGAEETKWGPSTGGDQAAPGSGDGRVVFRKEVGHVGSMTGDLGGSGLIIMWRQVLRAHSTEYLGWLLDRCEAAGDKATWLSAKPGGSDEREEGDTYGSHDTFEAASVAYAATLQALDRVMKVGSDCPSSGALRGELIRRLAASSG
jgi:hypothetical protein